jgi:hypothetical protein
MASGNPGPPGAAAATGAAGQGQGQGQGQSIGVTAANAAAAAAAANAAQGLGLGAPQSAAFSTDVEAAANAVADAQAHATVSNQDAVSAAVASLANALGDAGFAPGEVSQGNISTPFAPSIFGSFQGLIDPITGETLSPADVAALSPEAFSVLSSNPVTGVIGDPESPFGKALLGSKDITGLLSNPAMFAIEAALFGNKTLGLEGLATDAFNGLGDSISNLSPGDVTPSTATSPGNSIGAPVPSQTQTPATMSTSQLLQQLLGTPMSPEQFDQARSALLDTLATGDNPFQGDTGPDQFLDVVTRGFDAEAGNLPENFTIGNFRNTFDNPNLLDNILGSEERSLKEGFQGKIGETFTGDAFESIDDDIINSIVEERSGPARAQISNLEARGQFNALGGASSNEALNAQTQDARDRVSEIGSTVQSGNQRDVNSLRDVANTSASGFELGDDLFDITPFVDQRQQLIDTRSASLGEDIRTSLGSEPLFDIPGAISAGSQASGSVSGPTGNTNFLDAIAQREASTRKNRRGLSSSGSGAF